MVSDGRSGGQHARVAHQHEVASEQVLVLLQESGQTGRPYLLFPFEDELHVVTQFARTHHIFESLQLHHALPLVVVSAAGIDPPVAHFWLEGRAGPQVQRVGRHDVVMTVDQHRRGIVCHALFGIHQRISGRRHQPRLVGPRFQQQRAPALGAGHHVGLVRRVGTDAGNAQQAEPLVHEPGFILPDIFFDCLHNNGVYGYYCQYVRFTSRRRCA